MHLKFQGLDDNETLGSAVISAGRNDLPPQNGSTTGRGTTRGKLPGGNACLVKRGFMQQEE